MLTCFVLSLIALLKDIFDTSMLPFVLHNSNIPFRINSRGQQNVVISASDKARAKNEHRFLFRIKIWHNVIIKWKWGAWSMEELLKEFMKEMREFRSEVNQRLDTLEDFRTKVNQRFDGVDKQFATFNRQFAAVNQRFNNMESDNLSFRTEVNQQFKGLKEDVCVLKSGQEDIKDILRHNTALLTENFTDIGIDLIKKNSDMKSDIDLLFREVEDVKRETNKIKQKLGN
jgi:hypothetical protein